MRRPGVVVVLLALGLVCGGAGSARAGQVTIEYEITGTVGVSGIPAIGSLTASFPATDINTLVPGPGSIATFAFGGCDIPGSGAGGCFNFNLLSPPLAGTFTGTLLQATQTAYIALQQIVCAPCITFTGTNAYAPMATPTPTPTQGFWAGPGGTGAAVRFSYGSAFGVGWVGTEVSRTFMPEPRGAWVLPSSAMTLAALSWRRRRRRPC